MRYLSMIWIDEKSGQAPSEQLMQDMGKLIDEMIRAGSLISTAGLRPTAEGVRVRLRRGKLSKSLQEAIELTKRFLRVHGDAWDIECEVRQLDGPEFACGAETNRQQTVSPAKHAGA